MVKYKVCWALLMIPIISMVFLGSPINIKPDMASSRENSSYFIVPNVSQNPQFLETADDLIVNNNTYGYYLQWNATDDNPHIYVIFRNDTGNTVQATGIWESGIFRYELPSLNVGIYNFTLYLFDQDMNSIVDNATVTATNLGLPEITDVNFIQGGKNVSFLTCGGGPFSITFKNQTNLNFTITPTAIDENLNIAAELRTLGITLDGLWPDTSLLITPESLTKGGLWEGNIYNNTSPQVQYNANTYNITPSNTDLYVWMIQAYSPSTPISYEVEPFNPLPMVNLTVRNILDISLGLLNIIHIEVNDGVPFICNGSAYDWNDDSACRLEIRNVDINSPIYNFKEEYKVVNTGYEISIKCSEPTAYESGVFSVDLYYTINDGNLTKISMLEYQGIWGAIIPKQDEATIKYYIVIIDQAGNIATTAVYTFIIEKEEILSEGIIVAIIAIGAALALSIFLSIIFRGTTNIVIKKVEGLQ